MFRSRAAGVMAAVLLCAAISDSAQADPPRMSMSYGSEAARWSTVYATAGSDGRPLGATLTVTPTTAVLASDPLISATTQDITTYSSH